MDGQQIRGFGWSNFGRYEQRIEIPIVRGNIKNKGEISDANNNAAGQASARQ